MEQETFAARMHEFLSMDNPGFDPGTVTEDANLFNLGLLESFSIPRLIRFLEETVGGPIPLERSTIESFFSIGSIYRTFVSRMAEEPEGSG